MVASLKVCTFKNICVAPLDLVRQSYSCASPCADGQEPGVGVPLHLFVHTAIQPWSLGNILAKHVIVVWLTQHVHQHLDPLETTVGKSLTWESSWYITQWNLALTWQWHLYTGYKIPHTGHLMLYTSDLYCPTQYQYCHTLNCVILHFTAFHVFKLYTKQMYCTALNYF